MGRYVVTVDVEVDAEDESAAENVVVNRLGSEGWVLSLGTAGTTKSEFQDEDEDWLNEQGFERDPDDHDCWILERSCSIPILVEREHDYWKVYTADNSLEPKGEWNERGQGDGEWMRNLVQEIME